MATVFMKWLETSLQDYDRGKVCPVGCWTPAAASSSSTMGRSASPAARACCNARRMRSSCAKRALMGRVFDVGKH